MHNFETREWQIQLILETIEQNLIIEIRPYGKKNMTFILNILSVKVE